MLSKHVRRLVRQRGTRRVPGCRTWTAAERAHYATHKEEARQLVYERLTYWNQFYNLSYNRVSIKNTRTRWGSCSSQGNLNFNYRILFLPPELQDYLVVHELCHLREMNHGSRFWELVGEQVPDYQQCIRDLRVVEKQLFHRGTIEV